MRVYEYIRKFTIHHSILARYLFNSVIAMLVDVSIVWVLMNYTDIKLVASNTIGIIVGFFIQYILSLKRVFNREHDMKGFIVYFVTFIFGLVLANVLIYISYEYFFILFSLNLRLLLSKAVSIVIPFFAMYFIRKRIYDHLAKAEG